jgi:AICAR transformylase/IMP cyclohydrolase PurH
MPRYQMNTPPDQLPPADDVDAIRAMEAFEESDVYDDIVRDWMASDGEMFDIALVRFPMTAAYDAAFEQWLQDRA